MKVLKPIGPLKIENTIYRMTVGKVVPDRVLKYLTDAGQLQNLINQGIVEGKTSHDNRVDDIEIKTSETKKGYGFIRKSKSGQQKDSE